MNATLGEVSKRLGDVAVGDLDHREIGALLKSREHEISAAGRGRPVELAGFRARTRGQLGKRADLERADLERAGCGNPYENIGRQR